MVKNNTSHVGNLTKNPELVISGDKKYCHFRLAVNEWNGNEEIATFIPFIAWGNQAESITKFAKKGDQLIIGGRVQVSQWEKDGINQERIQIVVTDFCFGNVAKSNRE